MDTDAKVCKHGRVRLPPNPFGWAHLFIVVEEKKSTLTPALSPGRGGAESALDKTTRLLRVRSVTDVVRV